MFLSEARTLMKELEPFETSVINDLERDQYYLNVRSFNGSKDFSIKGRRSKLLILLKTYTDNDWFYTVLDLTVKELVTKHLKERIRCY